MVDLADYPLDQSGTCLENACPRIISRMTSAWIC